MTKPIQLPPIPDAEAYLYINGDHRGVSLHYRSDMELSEGTSRIPLIPRDQVINYVQAAIKADRKRRSEPWMPVESCPGGNGVRYLFVRDCGQGTLSAVEMGYMLDADTEVYMDSTHEPFTKYGYRVTHWTHLPGLPNTPQPAEPVKVRPETDSEHIARDIREGRFPEKSDRKMVPAEPVKGQTGKTVLQSNQSLNTPVKVPSFVEITNLAIEYGIMAGPILQGSRHAHLNESERFDAFIHTLLARYTATQTTEPSGSTTLHNEASGAQNSIQAAQPAEPVKLTRDTDMAETRNVLIHLDATERTQMQNATDHNEWFRAIGYLSTWNMSFPTVVIRADGETDMVAVYKDENGNVGYVIGAVWHDDHYEFHS